MTDRPREGEPLSPNRLYDIAFRAMSTMGTRKSIDKFDEVLRENIQSAAGREASDAEVAQAVALLEEHNGVGKGDVYYTFPSDKQKKTLDTTAEPEPPVEEEPDDEDYDDDEGEDIDESEDGDEHENDEDDDNTESPADDIRAQMAARRAARAGGNAAPQPAATAEPTTPAEPIAPAANPAPAASGGGSTADDIRAQMAARRAARAGGNAAPQPTTTPGTTTGAEAGRTATRTEQRQPVEPTEPTTPGTEPTEPIEPNEPTTTTNERPEPTTPSEPAPAQEPHHSVHMNERQFTRWSKRIEALHRRLLHIITNLESGELSKLKQEFKAETGEDWNEEFEVHAFLAERRVANVEKNDTEETTPERNRFSEHVTTYSDHIKDVISDKGLPDRRTGDAHLDELVDIVASEGVDHRRAVDIFVNDIYEAQMHRERDSVKADRAIFMILARMLDKLEAFHATVAAENFDENPPELEAARTTFLKAQEDFNEFERKILRNPFTSGKKRKELLRNLEEARTAYETESAKVIAGRANRFLGEYNKQIDEEIRIRDERRGDKGDGFFAKLKNTFYAGYKWLGDMSLDRLYRAQKHGDADAAKGNPRVEGNEPRGGRMIRKAANLRSAIGFGLGLAGLMSGPLKTVWRGAVGLGTGVGVYEGLKARTTAQLQAETHELLRQYADSSQDNPGRQTIIDTMQQIRMRAALDGKTVEDERFPLHESFAKLRTILEHEKRQLPEVSREQAYKNKDAILAALKGINADLEKQITDQSEQKRKQVLGAIAAGGASALVAPKVMELLGWGAEQIADWIVGDPAVSADVGPYPDDVVPPPEVPPTPPEIPEVIRAGEGFRVSLDNGEGAYHAVYKILDELSPAEQAELGEAIAKEHPEWVSRDANGDITNLDRVLRSWRHDIVDSAILDDGREAMLYDASTGEYGVMLHEGAQFSIEYDADGYPQLRLHGDAESGDYNILNENLIRTVDADGRGNFMTADEYQEHIAAEQAAASEPEVATPDAVEADTTGNTELVPDAVGDTMDRIAALGEQLDAAFEDGSLAGEASASADSPYEMLGDTPRDVDYPTVDDLEADDTLQEADALARTEALASQFTLDGGHTVEIAHTEGGDIAGINIDAGLLSNREVQYALLPEGSNPYEGVPMSERSSYDALLKRIYLMDEAVDQMIASGMQGTEEYDYLVSAVEADMQLAAERASTDVGTLFDRDIAEAYDFEVPEDTASSAVDAASGETFEARMDELRSSFEDSVNQMSPGELNVLETDVYTEYQSLLYEGRDILATEPQPSADQLARLEGIVEELNTIHTNFEAGIGVEPEVLDTATTPESPDTAPTTPDNYGDIMLPDDIADRIRVNLTQFERAERLELQAYMNDMRTLGREFDAAPDGSPEQASLANQLQSLRDSIVAIVERVERRAS